eukprot:2766543-Rhodomonas_salina.1
MLSPARALHLVPEMRPRCIKPDVCQINELHVHYTLYQECPLQPLISHCICLGLCYGMPGTHGLRGSCYGLSGTDLLYGATSSGMLGLQRIGRPVPSRECHTGVLPAYARAMRCPVLASRVVLSAYARAMRTSVAYSAICLHARCAMPGTDAAYGATRAWKRKLRHFW